MRKNINVNEALFSRKGRNKRVLNDIMNYLRKLIKLVKIAQSNDLRESGAQGNVYEDISNTLNKLNKSFEDIL